MAREIPRQAFVRSALAVAAGAVVSSCRTTAGPSPPSSPAAVDAGAWTALAGQIDGRVIMPSSTEYAAAKNVFNTRFATSTPAGVVTVTSSDDLRKAMALAATDGIPVTTRSGGHSYVGASAANGTMVIDLRQLPGGDSYDDRTGSVTVGAAAQLDSVLTRLAARGRSIPAGSCPTVGVSGLTLGGGLGSDARQWGLTCDALTSAAMVLPGGEAITAAPDDHADLFWALRGGGGGTCGVVTALTFRTSPTSDRDVVTLDFPAGATARAILGWHEWLVAADRAIWGMVNIAVGPGAGGATIVLATPPGAGPDTAKEVIAAIGIAPLNNTSRTLGRVDFIHYFEGGAQARQPRAFLAGSDVIDEMTHAAVDAIVAATSAWPGAMGSATAVIESLSGAIGDVSATDTAFPWRGQAACVQWYAETPSAETLDAATKWLAGAHVAVQASSVGGYVNYLEAQTPAARYFGGNLERLRDVRRKYDPDELMYSGLSF